MARRHVALGVASRVFLALAENHMRRKYRRQHLAWVL